jgi:ATP-dependent Clp protease ATP-binding subunit ClpC
MADGICDFDNRRPATHIVRVRQNGREAMVELCDIHYQQLRRQQAQTSPFESLFFDSPLNNFIGDDFSSLASRLGMPLPREREATNIEDFISENTKEIIQQAADTAVRFGRPEVDTEHLLYALADSDVVQEIFKQFNLNSKDVKGYIDANAPKSDQRTSEKENVRVAVSPRMKQVLESAFGSSRELGHGYVGPEHLLIGLVQEGEGMAGDVLRKYGLTPESLRQQVVKVIGKGAEEGRVEGRSSTPQLDKYSRDLSELARQGKLDPVVGRSKEIETTIEILARRTKNNPVLIGEPGVGKTAIVEGLAQRIYSGKVPQVLQNKRVVEVNLNAMVAGSKYRGEFEERIKEVLDEIIAHQDELIIFIDELHTVVGAGQGGGEGGLDVSNVIKPSLARGELHLIGATTLNEYQKYIEKDAALERRFQPVLVSEPTVEQAIEILRGLRDKYEAHHRVKITDEAIVAAAELSDRYISNRFLPDKAIDLIDQAASRVRIGADTYSQDIAELDDQIKRAKREHEYAVNHKQMDKAKDMQKQLKELENKKEESAHKWQSKRGVTSQEVLVEQVAQVVSNITGIPVQELTQEERDKLLHMEERLHERVIGQDEAVQAVADAVRMSRAGLNERDRPIATVMFLGPTGVGKTELAKALAYTVFGDEDALIRIDMSEYMERHSVARLIGAPPGYVGYEEGGQLTERVRRNPYSVVLLDEIEKAHPDVHNILLQVFDDGRLTDGKGRVVDFTNTIIIATSNVGASTIHENVALKKGQRKTYTELKQELLKLLRDYFRPEFLNRIDEIIVFEALDEKQIEQIVTLQLERIKRTARGQDIELIFEDSVARHLAKIGYLPEYGARELRRQIKSEIENRLARGILKGEIGEGSSVAVSYDSKKGVLLNLSKPKLREVMEDLDQSTS